MEYNKQIKDLLDNIIADLSNHRELYVKSPGVDFTRDRKLPFDKVIKIILSMKGGSINKELYEFFGKDPDAIATSSAFIQQRDKLIDDLFVELFHKFTNAMTDMKLYKGYRLLAVDGSDINVAYDEQADTYMKPQKTKKDGELSKGYNQYHLNAVYDLLNKIYVEAAITPRPQADERKAFVYILENMDLLNKTIFVADREYPSWNVFVHFKYKENAEYLIRVKDSENNIVKALPMAEVDMDRTVIASTIQSDRNKENHVIIKVKKKTQNEWKWKPKQWDFGDREEITIRVCRFKITDDTYETIFTSLPRDKFPIEEIKKLYGMRWGIETSFRELKYVIGLTHLHAKKDAFVRQEIYAKLTMYNFCERIISAVVIEQDENRKHNYQINYTMGMTVCLDFYRALVETGDVYTLMLKYIEAVRSGRSDKRKMKPKTFVCFTYRVAA